MLVTPQEFAYNLDHDHEVFRAGIVEVGGHDLEISLATITGNKEPGGPQKLQNEDACALGIRQLDGTSASQTLDVAVLDGASSLDPIPRLAPETGAHFASHSLARYFMQVPDGLAPQEAMEWLNDRLGEDLQRLDVNLEDADTLPTSTAVLFRFDPQTGRLDTADVGDSELLVGFDNGSTARLTHNTHSALDDRIFNQMRQYIEDEGLTALQARKDPRIWKAVRQMFRESRNITEGIINGSPGMKRFIHATTLLSPRVIKLCAFTDGAIPPDMDMDNSDDREIIFDMLDHSGARGLIEHARLLYDTDPSGERYIRYGDKDDALAVYVRDRTAIGQLALS